MSVEQVDGEELPFVCAAVNSSPPHCCSKCSSKTSKCEIGGDGEEVNSPRIAALKSAMVPPKNEEGLLGGGKTSEIDRDKKIL